MVEKYHTISGQMLNLSNSDYLTENLSPEGYNRYINSFNNKEREIIEDFINEKKFTKEEILSYLNNGGKDIEKLLEHIVCRLRDEWETDEFKFFSDSNIRNNLVPNIYYWHKFENSEGYE